MFEMQNACKNPSVFGVSGDSHSIVRKSQTCLDWGMMEIADLDRQVALPTSIASMVLMRDLVLQGLHSLLCDFALFWSFIFWI